MKTFHLFGGFLVVHARGLYGRCKNGRGLSVEWIGKNYKPLFSERNGYRKATYWLGFRIERLTP